MTKFSSQVGPKIFLAIVIAVPIMLYMYACTDIFTSKEDLVKRGNRYEMDAARQKMNFLKDGDRDHLYGAELHYRDAIKAYYQAIEKEQGDVEFDKEMKNKIDFIEKIELEDK